MIGTRWPELLLALLLMGGGRHGHRRQPCASASAGPTMAASGYFPFYIGLLMLAPAAWSAFVPFCSLARLTKRSSPHAAAGSVLAMLIRCLVYVAGIKLLGIYLASAC
jgi:putative tricarboxylic transport membrane protein